MKRTEMDEEMPVTSAEMAAEASVEGAPSAAASKATLFAGVVAGVVALDFATKIWVQRTFHLYEQTNVIGDYVRLTYIYNPGAAFGIDVGHYSRGVFLVLSMVALVALAAMYWATPVFDRLRLSSIALICGGALGNLVDRVRSSSGVVDFVDIGIGTVRWPVFNVADMAVTIGAVLLALSLWQEERRPHKRGVDV